MAQMGSTSAISTVFYWTSSSRLSRLSDLAVVRRSCKHCIALGSGDCVCTWNVLVCFGIHPCAEGRRPIYFSMIETPFIYL